MRRIFEEHWLDVVRYVARRSTAVDAEDVAATVFQRAWEHLDEIEDGAVLTWLLRVAQNRTVDVWRSSRLTAPASSPGEHDAASVSENVNAATDLAVDLNDALQRLTDQDRELLSLAYWEELSSREAAAVIGCSPVAYRVRLHRARRRLRAAYQRSLIVNTGTPAVEGTNPS